MKIIITLLLLLIASSSYALTAEELSKYLTTNYPKEIAENDRTYILIDDEGNHAITGKEHPIYAVVFEISVKQGAKLLKCLETVKKDPTKECRVRVNKISLYDREEDRTYIADNDYYYIKSDGYYIYALTKISGVIEIAYTLAVVTNQKEGK